MRRPQPPGCGVRSQGPGVKPQGPRVKSPDSIRTVKTKPPSRRKNITRKTGKNRSRRKQGCRPGQKSVLKKALPVIVILSAAAALIFLFRMDLTQIGGMGFLSAALIWLTYSTLGKRRSEIHNVWADEDDPGDDAFYQSLLKQVYAEDESAAGGIQSTGKISAEGKNYTAGRAETCPDYTDGAMYGQSSAAAVSGYNAVIFSYTSWEKPPQSGCDTAG